MAAVNSEQIRAIETLMSAAGVLAIKIREEGLEVQIKEERHTNITTRADSAVGTLLGENLTKLFPGDTILDEENGGYLGESGWTIDGIDGTVAYERGLPLWTITIARIVQDKPEIAATYCPALDELYFAAKDYGAYLNGRPIRVSDRNKITEAMVFFGPDTLRRANRVDAALGLARNFRSHNVIPSSALTWAWLAAGKIDVVCHLTQSSWDMTAGWLLVTEAGGKITKIDGVSTNFDLSGARTNDLMGSNGLLSTKLSDYTDFALVTEAKKS